MTRLREIVLAGALILVLPGVVRAEPQPTSVTTATITLDITPPDPFSPFSADRMAALPDGTRFVLGSGASNSGSFQFLLKVNPNGTQAWAAPVASLFTSDVKGLAADASGNAYVAYTDFSDLSQPHARVVKYNAAGGVAANADLTTDTPGGDGFPFSEGVGVDSVRGRVYAAYSFFSSVQSQEAFAVSALDTDLLPVANRVYDPGFTGGLGVLPNGGTFVDGVGDVWVLALQIAPTPGPAMLAVRFTPNLAGASPLLFDSPTVEELGGAADPRGGIVAAGDRQADGNLYLHRVTAGGFGGQFRFEGFDSVPSPMAVDPAGNLYILGFDTATFLPAATKVNASNALAWDQPGPYLNFPATFALGAVAAPSSTTFDVAGISFDASPSPVVLLHYQSAASSTAAFALSIATGNAQPGTITKAARIPLTVKVADVLGVGVAGATVTFSTSAVPSGAAGHGLSVISTTTAQDGTATSILTFGDRVGTYTVTAACAGCAPSAVTFSALAQLFVRLEPDVAVIAPVAIDQVVRAGNKVRLTVTAYGVGGTTDAVVNYPLGIRSEAVSFSGGHDHSGSRPDGIFSGGAGVIVFESSATGRSDSNGQLFVVFTSTFFSGTNEFLAGSIIDMNAATATARVAVRAGDFELLPDATYYIKDGGTCEHHGPDGPTGCILPDRNHYGLPTTNAMIAEIAIVWLAAAGTGRMLEINDMSLPLGGGFDVGGNWTSNITDLFLADKKRCNTVGHCGHRGGREVDIQVRPNLSPGSLTQKQQQKLRDIILNRNGQIHTEGSHWHVRL
jgi:hypothetical protein